MFGRKSKTPSNDVAPKTSAHGPAPTDGALLVSEAGQATEAEPMGSETDSPLRAEGAGHDSGLAAIEAEATISAADRDLLDVASLAYDQLSSPLSDAEVEMAARRADLDAFLEQTSASWSEQAKVQLAFQPFFMIPERCWDGEHQEVLVAVLGLAPAQAWNVLPLASDAVTARTIGVPVHPGTKSLDHRQLASTLIEESLAKMSAAFERATFAGDSVDTEGMEQARSDASREIVAIARRMAATVIGAEAVDRVRATFFAD